MRRKYPWKPAADLLRDLVAPTPESEGKWFAAAKYSPCDPKTLSRAARDFKEKRPDFAFEASLAALRCFAEGYGYEITSNDVIEAYNDGSAVAERLDRADDFKARASATLEADCQASEF